MYLDATVVREHLVITVRNTGIGIEEEDISRLFDDFMRVKSPETKHISGSGLGLSIVKRIVTLYNGEITVESRLGEGTTFTITIPVVSKAK